jgi:hypothetical protein
MLLFDANISLPFYMLFNLGFAYQYADVYQFFLVIPFGWSVVWLE